VHCVLTSLISASGLTLTLRFRFVRCMWERGDDSDLTAYLSAQYLARHGSQDSAQANSIQRDAKLVSSETFHWARGGVSGGTVGSAFVVAEMEKRRLQRGMGEFALTFSK
jgi:hypothetical protein